MVQWITDREPTIKDGDPFGHVLTVGYSGDVIVERFDQVDNGTPWMPTPTPPVKKSTRWYVGTQHNFLTDGGYTVIISGGENKRDRQMIVQTILDVLNKELP